MIQVIDKLYLSNSILTIAIIDEKLIAVDASYNFYIYDYKNKKFVDKISLAIDKEPIYKYIKAININKDGYLSLIFKDDKKVLLYKFTQNHLDLLKEFDYHKAKAEVSAFYSNKYLSTGGEDGRVFLYDLEHLELLDDVYVRPEFISSIFFSDNGNQLFCSSYDNSAILYSTQTAKILKKFTTDNIVEDGVFFDTKLFFIEREGVSYIYDMKKRAITSKEQNQLVGWATKVIKITNSFALIATRSSFLYVLDLNSNSISFSVDMEIKDISSITVYENMIFVGFVSGELKIIDYKFGYEELAISLKLQDFAKINKLIEQNRFLMLSDEMQNFNKDWNGVFDRAKVYLLSGKDTEAKELVKPFLNDKKREVEFNIYLQNRFEIVNFIKDIEKKDFVSAFKKAEANHFLTTLPLFEKVENYWESLFNKAKLMLEQDSTNKLAVIKLLQPYSNIDSKKSLIANLLNNIDIFSKCEKLVKERKFRDYFNTIEKFGFLKDTLLYRKVMTLANKLYQDMLNNFEKDDFENTLQIANTLKVFEPFEKKVTEIEELTKVKQDFIFNIDTNKKLCFELLVKYPFLQQTKEYDKLIKDFELRIDRAKDYAYSGKTDKVEKVLKDYLSIEYTIDKVAEVFKISYINEFEKNYDIEKQSGTDLDMVLNNYIQRFGKDIFLFTMLKNKNLLVLVDNIDDGDIPSYKKLGFVDSIFNIT